MANTVDCNPFQLDRQGIVLTPDPTNPYEAGGVLNPAAVSNNNLTYLFYRAVALKPHNYSRILIATCNVNSDGSLGNVQRLNKIALEPEASYELWANGKGGGVEDPRITRISSTYYMTYTAYGTVDGKTAPRVALAKSKDLMRWQRMGLIHYTPVEIQKVRRKQTYDLNKIPNKDAVLFPTKIGGRYAMLHRPTFKGSTHVKQSIWLSFSTDMMNWTDHKLVIGPRQGWESFKVGAGTPPLLLDEGWLVFYHGVDSKDIDPDRHYYAGALILHRKNPAKVLYRSDNPILSPENPEEKRGVVNNVVFPCGAVVNLSGFIEVYYGMADRAIGLATTPISRVALPTHKVNKET